MIRERGQHGAGAEERERAETLALNAVGFLLEDERTANGFLAATGLGTDELRDRLGDADFLGGVLDYLLGREALLVAFCDRHEIEPTLPLRLRRALPGAIDESYP